jgi:hypothetical protein
MLNYVHTFIYLEIIVVKKNCFTQHIVLLKQVNVFFTSILKFTS